VSIKNFSRTSPYLSRIQERSLLTGLGSTKKTYHIVLEVEENLFPYKAGDSIGVIPQNDPEEVDAIIQRVKCLGTEEIRHPKLSHILPLRDFLLHHVNISRVNLPFLKLVNPSQILDKPALTNFLHHHTLLETLSLFPLDNTAHFTQLMPLLPRFYSIANSSLVFPNEIHLTVAFISYNLNGQLRKGVGSHFLCILATPGVTPIPIYLQPSNLFSLPKNPNASIILIGPGTGIAPFRAFLQERIAMQSLGKNWLFFGERNRASDFYYESFFNELMSLGKLRLDLAFSRDQNEKIYVQHKMYEERKSLWSWLSDGAYFYVCGDAEEMAKDVDAMLHRIVKEEGNMSEENARLYVKNLRLEKRYLTDVY